MKKLLAMVLALVMTLSLAVSANAFKDDKSISDDYAEAVAVLNGMGVFKGYEDGSFKPEGNITRAEVATIIYRIYTADVAKNDKSGLYATYNKFSDMAGASWAAGYIDYCANAALVKGYPDGTFKPSGNVTGYEVLAMILRTVGYDKNNEFSGADWALHVAQTAQQLGLLKNVKGVDLNAPATRELVAELLFRGIQASTVTYTPAFGYVTDKVINTATTTIGVKNFKLDSKDTADKWGRPGTLWTYNTGDKKTTVIDKPDVSYTKAVAECDVAHDAGLTADTAYSLYVNGKVQSAKYTVNLTDTTTKLGAQGRLVEVYDDVIVMIDIFLAKVQSVSDAAYDAQGHLRKDASITLLVYDGTSNKELTLTNGKDNYSYVKGDYVLLNAYTLPTNDSKVSGAVAYTGTEGTDYYGEIVAKAESLTGAQTIIYWNNEQHNVAGTVYDDAVKFILDEAGNSTENHTWFLDQYGNLIGAADIAATNSYGVINRIWWVGNTADGTGVATANVTYMDGTTGQVSISKINVDAASQPGQPYVAHFVQKTYQVTFNANATDATGKMEPQTFTHGDGKALTANAFVRPGYSFLGWATTEGSSVAYKNQQVVSIVENTTLYAVWREDTVTLFYDTADAAMGTVSPESENVSAVTTEKASGATAAANDGYRFIGWYSEMGDKLSDRASFAPQKPNGEQPEDSIWKTAHYIARFERVGDPKPIDPVKPGGDDSKDSYYFAIEKIDAQDSHALNGATFALYQYSSDGKTVNRTTATTSRNGSESGIALFSVDNKNSYEGIWYYAEVTAPEGYVLDSTEHKITKNDFSTSQSAAIRNAETVRNYRSSTPNVLNDTDHFAYVIGYKDGLVKPYGLITRAETTTIFFRLLKDSVRDSSLLTSSTYTDVPDNYWANTAISTMTGLGIVQGRSTTTFDPQSPITRAQFAAICARFDTGTSSGTQTFSDISGHWAEKYIQRAAELGWIKGFEDGTFRPDTYITRAQTMTMINRVLNRIPEEESDLLTGMNVWPDCNPGDWFYLAVQEATNSHAFKHKAGNYETWIGMSQNPDWTRYEN